ncbi:MAG: hypothetical protein JWL85_944 [Candidatus Saccharibacteria bacterium]|nr:hypothetical protein [Candidatus Saccharibacteria bacterium]
MERNSDSNASDKDAQMMGSFEKFNDSKESGEKKEKKSKNNKKSSPRVPLFVSPEGEKEEGSVETKPSSTVESLFEPKEKLEAVNTTPEQAEAEQAPLESLSSTEKQEAAAEYVAASSADVRDELEQVTPDTAEELEAAANAAFLEAIDARIKAGEDPESALDPAATEAIERLQLTPHTEVPEESEDKTDYTSADTPPVPPAPPRRAYGASPPPSGPSRSGYAHMSPLAPGNPNVSAQDMRDTVDNYDYNHRRSNRRHFLAGGIVGYFIGRRRGRINTEEKLLPIQKKLEKQVNDIHNKIAQKEMEIRAAAKKSFEAGRESVKPTAETRVPIAEARHSRELHARQKVSERLGPMVVTTEARAAITKNPEQMTVPELLNVATLVSVEGVSVRAMYEQGRIDHIGLRRAMKEHLSGGSVDRILPSILLGKERIRERSLEREPSAQAFGDAADGQANQSATPSSWVHPRATSELPVPSVYQPEPASKAQAEKNRTNQTKTVGVTLAILAAVAALLLLVK